MKVFEVDGLKVIDTFCEAFDGLFTRIIVTAENRKLLEKAVCSATALPSTVFGKSEAGLERWLSEDETPDNRVGAVIQIWVNYSKKAKEKLEDEVGWRVRQGILVVPTTRVFNALEGEDKIDTLNKIGHCGDGYEFFEKRFGRDVINIPIMMGEFLIERYIGVARGIAGGNIWFFCRDIESALEAGEEALKAIKNVAGVVTPFDICSAGSKPETKFPEIGPTTNHYYCPTLKNKIPDSLVPEGVNSIPEIVINGVNLEAVKEAMKAGILAVKNVEGVLYVGAGNYGGKLGKYKIYLKDILR